MDKIYEQTMLFDFYGELLTEHQRSVYEDALYNDLSLSEIAQSRGISRQGVHDLIRRCDRILQDYESKLHLVERFAKAKRTVEEIERLTYGCEAQESARMDSEDSQKAEECIGEGDFVGMRQRMKGIRTLSRELLKEL